MFPCIELKTTSPLNFTQWPWLYIWGLPKWHCSHLRLAAFKHTSDCDPLLPCSPAVTLAMAGSTQAWLLKGGSIYSGWLKGEIFNFSFRKAPPRSQDCGRWLFIGFIFVLTNSQMLTCRRGGSYPWSWSLLRSRTVVPTPGWATESPRQLIHVIVIIDLTKSEMFV